MRPSHVLTCVAAVFLAMVLPPGRADAYSVATHERITRFAVKQIRVCVDRHRARLGKHAKAVDAQLPSLVGCNRMQDRWLRKAAVWHFYSPAGPPTGRWSQGSFVALSTRLDGWFERLAEAMGSGSSAEDAYALAGAVGHYLQDVTAPPHAVPIYHPSPIWNPDNFDEYPFTEPELVTDQDGCERLLAGDRGWPELLRDAATATLRSIAQPIEGLAVSGNAAGVPADWGLFWKADPKQGGFGAYGCAGDLFGAERFRCEGREVTVPPGSMAAFARQRHREAVAVTIAAIAAVQVKLGDVPVPDPARACPVAGRDEGGVLALRWRRLSPRVYKPVDASRAAPDSEGAPGPLLGRPMVSSVDSGQVRERGDEDPPAEGRFFCIHKPNYFLFGLGGSRRSTVDTSVSEHITSKLQTSFKFSMLSIDNGDDAGCTPHRGSNHVFFGFTLKALWALYAKSSPFDESNYNPELFWSRFLRQPYGGLYRYMLGFEHESSGEDGLRSRSWNNLYFEVELAYPLLPGIVDEVRLRPRIWWITPLQDGRRDGLDRNIGYWRLVMEWRSLGNSWGGYEVDVLVAAGSQLDRGRIVAGAMYDPWVAWIPAIYFQLFHGYGETLIRSHVRSTEYRLGFRLVEY